MAADPSAEPGTPLLAAVLADGMGGHTGGALASGLACKFFLHAFTSSSGNVPARLDEALQPRQRCHCPGGRREQRAARHGLHAGRHRLRAGRIEWVSVGDSPLFLVRKGEIVLLNEDHSLAPQIDKLAAAGKISWDVARADPRRHYLRSALTGGEMELIDRSRRPLPLEAGDIVILASDGIHTLAQADILRVVQENAEAGPDGIAEGLLAAVEAACEAYQDNTTVVVVAVRPD